MDKQTKDVLLSTMDYYEYMYGLPAHILSRIADIETHGTWILNSYNSVTGAKGLMGLKPQLIESVQSAFKTSIDPMHPVEAIKGAAMALKRFLNIFGAWDFAVMAYAADEDGLKKWVALVKSGEAPAVSRYVSDYVRYTIPQYNRFKKQENKYYGSNITNVSG